MEYFIEVFGKSLTEFFTLIGIMITAACLIMLAGKIVIEVILFFNDFKEFRQYRRNLKDE